MSPDLRRFSLLLSLTPRPIYRMDPITVFQVAGTVVTFVEFGRTLLNQSREVYRSPSGATSRVVQLSSIANDLTNIGNHISESLKQSPTSSTTGSDTTLTSICARCIVLKDELQEALQGLEARGDTKFDLARRSVAVAFKSIWSQGKIDDLDRRLREVQSKMQMAVLMSLWEEERIHGRSRQEYLDQNMGAILTSVNRTDQKLKQFMQDLLQTSSNHSPEGTSKRNRDTLNGLETSSSDEVAHFIQQDVINSLWFEAIESRDRAISEPYKSTYEWVLDPDGSTKFVRWMEEDQSLLYWITGKAGSGKSTLMKYLAHHESTVRHLEKCAGELPLLFCHFYFWEATTEELQHSREGLIRTLLWQCLAKNPHLVRKVTPRRWAAYHALHGWEGPSWDELQETFQNLASLNHSSFKLVLFIDGLDEFDGDPADLVMWIKEIVTKFTIKLCVGSRPWNAFSDAFEQYPTLTMQTLTAPDIRTYINGHFNTSRAFRDWQVLSPDGTEALRQDLIKRADGVFLWVYIVVRELMSALEKGKSLHDLHAILISLPTDIMNLYTKVYGSADPEEANRAALYFSLLQAAVHKLTCYELWYIEEGNAVNLNDEAASIPMEGVIKRRLDSSTRGMIEVSKMESQAHESIVFHHRSVLEWLSLPGVMSSLSAHLPNHFDSRLLIMKGYRARLAQALLDDDCSKSDPTMRFGECFIDLYYILYYASQVSESAILDPALCQELEMLRDTFDQIAETMKKRGHRLLLKQADLRAKVTSDVPPRLKAILRTYNRSGRIHEQSAVDTGESDEYKIGHWSFAFTQSRDKAQSCFTVLAAGFAIYPYVIARVTANPDLLEEKNNRVSLLHEAIFGPAAKAELRRLPIGDYRLRLRLIEALLESGASVRGRIHIGVEDTDNHDVYYLDVIDRMSWKLELLGPQEYKIQVKRLLTERMSKGALFRRSLKEKFSIARHG
ncbi:hypothetical protein LB507_009842 [Fusarium sp. FIESC RH6]|nr:hypothetical protein LB507_009842 [Fusarium sp. FIESC RH6]